MKKDVYKLKIITFLGSIFGIFCAIIKIFLQSINLLDQNVFKSFNFG